MSDSLSVSVTIPKEADTGFLCTGCLCPVDPYTCYCGSGPDDHGWGSNHGFKPMGCQCRVAPLPPVEPPPPRRVYEDPVLQDLADAMEACEERACVVGEVGDAAPRGLF